MDIPTLSLIVAALAVFFGPIISWRIAKQQIGASSDLANAQINAALLTSNKQIVAPMRQAWINDLRDLLAELSSNILHYYLAGFEDRTDKEYQRLALIESKVKLMLNPREQDHRRLEELIRALVTTIERQSKFIDEFSELHDELVSLSRDVLKREWDRVKQPLSTSGIGWDG
jgi:hypothetical protein